jgi:predicted  nucleic acid-binding Zn-ribbon protein
VCYEDLKQLYASAAKERDELKKELEHVKRLYEMAKAERDAVTKRMIELEQEVAALRGGSDG